MKRINKKKIKKKSSKKKRRRINSKKKSYNKAIDLQKVMAVKFQTLTKVYEDLESVVNKFDYLEYKRVSAEAESECCPVSRRNMGFPL